MVFGLFSKEKSLDKTIAKATNKLAQQVDRWGALERLKADGSEAALVGLCKRWGITSTKGVEDEAEKNWVVDTLVAVGPPALPALVRYMAKADQLAFPLRVLERIAPRDKILEVADQLFASEPPGYVRMPERRIDLIRWLAEWKAGTDEEVVSRLVPYVGDFDENSRFAAIEGMAGRDATQIAPPLIAALIRPEEDSGRIKRTIVEVLERGRAPLGEHAAAVAAVLVGPLGDEFRVDGGAVVRR
jgi:hypothetical protein